MTTQARRRVPSSEPLRAVARRLPECGARAVDTRATLRAALPLLAILLAAPIAAQAQEVALLDGAVRMTLPAGYTQLSAEEIQLKFGRSNRPPLAAFGDARRNAAIAFTLSKQNRPVTEAALPEFLAAMEQFFPRMMAGLVWHKREIVSIRGRKWARLYLSGHALDTDVRNDMHFTPFRGDLLGVNQTTTEAAWAAASPALSSAFRSIRIAEPGR